MKEKDSQLLHSEKLKFFNSSGNVQNTAQLLNTVKHVKESSTRVQKFILIHRDIIKSRLFLSKYGMIFDHDSDLEQNFNWSKNHVSHVLKYSKAISNFENDSQVDQKYF